MSCRAAPEIVGREAPARRRGSGFRRGEALLLIFVALLPGVLAPVAVAAQAQAGAWSSPPAGPPLVRQPGSAAVLALATPEWMGVATEPAGLLGDFRYLPESSTEDTRGQLFVVLDADGGGIGSEAERLRAGDRFLAVPWTLGCGCAEEGWGDTIWVSPGDTVAFLLTPTRGEPAAAGPPVFDVLGWHQPYPSGEMIPYWRRERLMIREWISTRDYFDYLAALPTETRVRLAEGEAVQGVLGWAGAVPGRATSFPVATILQEWEDRIGALSLSPSRTANQGRSWSGMHLWSRPPSAEEAARIEAADETLARSPESVPALLEAARAREPVWRYREAIELYRRAEALAPDDFEPPLGQAHRLMRVRDLEGALAALDRARELDPTGFNTAYLRGLTLYLMGRFQEAAEEYAACLVQGGRGTGVAPSGPGALDGDRLAADEGGPTGESPAPPVGDPRQCSHVGSDPASRVAMTAWFVRALRRSGEEARARAVLAELPETLDADLLDGPFPQYQGSPIVPGDNIHYWSILRFYRGDLSAEELLEDESWGEQWPTVAHGVAAWWIAEGRVLEARTLLEEIVADPHWARFGHLAADADLRRLKAHGGSTPPSSP